MPYEDKCVFSMPFVKELWRKGIGTVLLRDAVLPGPPEGAWVYRLIRYDEGTTAITIGYAILYESVAIPGSLHCLHMYGDCNHDGADGVQTAISRGFDAVQYHYSDVQE
ncbi:MAG: hypothetical protein HY365_00765 [Candidatus Aenigmarchaeota archaeon]|nr:hypothetical protein [Candidatus Aenigmarchaeota archaeon]